MNHVTLYGRTFFYTAEAVYLKGHVIYRGVVTMKLLKALAKVI